MRFRHGLVLGLGLGALLFGPLYELIEQVVVDRTLPLIDIDS